MIKQLLLPLCVGSSLFAKDIEEMDKIVPLAPEVVQNLYIESALFITVFTLMSIASIIISKKHATQNALDTKEKREKEKIQEASEKNAQSTFIESSPKIKRAEELAIMLKDGLITEEEFQVLNHASKVKSA